MSQSESQPEDPKPAPVDTPPITPMGNGSVPLRDISKLLDIAFGAIAASALVETYPAVSDPRQFTLATAIELGKVAIYVPSVASKTLSGGPIYEVVMNWDGSQPSVETIVASQVSDWPSLCRPLKQFQ